MTLYSEMFCKWTILIFNFRLVVDTTHECRVFGLSLIKLFGTLENLNFAGIFRQLQWSMVPLSEIPKVTCKSGELKVERLKEK